MSKPILYAITILSIFAAATTKNFKIIEEKISLQAETQNIQNDDIPEYEKYIDENGYKFERHYVKSDDGYISTLWRLPSKKDQEEQNTKPIILMHGLFDSSWTFFIQEDPHKCLAFLLVDNGYDVWLPNIRGNLFSLNHTYLDPKDHLGKFWDFTFEELGEKDIPNFISYIKDITNKEKVDFIGHSQGTASFWIAYMTNQKFMQESINHYVGLGSVWRMKNNPSEMLKFCVQLTTEVLEIYPLGDIFLFNKEMHDLFRYICKLFPRIIELVVDGLMGNYPSGKINYEFIEELFHYFPGGSSAKLFKYWTQIYRSQKMQKFDYGIEENLKRYGRLTPPEYEFDLLKDVNFKMLFSVTDNDVFTSLDEYEEVINMFNKDKVQKVVVDGYNHFDVLDGVEAYDDIFKKIVEFLEN